MTATRMFYISSTSPSGEDVSTFCEARDANEAVNLWHEWLREFAPEEYANDVPTPDRTVFALPELAGTSRYFRWHTPDGVQSIDI